MCAGICAGAKPCGSKAVRDVRAFSLIRVGGRVREGVPLRL